MSKTELVNVCAEQGLSWPEAVTVVAVMAAMAVIGWALLR